MLTASLLYNLAGTMPPWLKGMWTQLLFLRAQLRSDEGVLEVHGPRHVALQGGRCRGVGALRREGSHVPAAGTVGLDHRGGIGKAICIKSKLCYSSGTSSRVAGNPQSAERVAQKRYE